MNRINTTVTGAALLVCLIFVVILFPLLISDIYLRRGISAAKDKNMEKAETLFQRALLWDDDNSETYRELGELYLRASSAEIDRFFKQYRIKKLIRSQPPVKLSSQVGDEVFDEKVTVKELTGSEIRRRLKQGPGEIRAVSEETVWVFPPYPGSSQGYEKKAVKVFRKGIELNPYDARLYRGMAEAMQWAAKVKETEAVFKRAVELDPNNPNIHFSFSLFYLRKKKKEHALLEMRKAASLYPFDARRAYTQWVANGGRIDELKAVAGTSPTALCNLGLYFENKKYPIRATDVFLTACHVVGGNSSTDIPGEQSRFTLLPLLLKKLEQHGKEKEYDHYKSLWRNDLEEESGTKQ